MQLPLLATRVLWFDAGLPIPWVCFRQQWGFFLHNDLIHRCIGSSGGQVGHYSQCKKWYASPQMPARQDILGFNLIWAHVEWIVFLSLKLVPTKNLTILICQRLTTYLVLWKGRSPNLFKNPKNSQDWTAYSLDPSTTGANWRQLTPAPLRSILKLLQQGGPVLCHVFIFYAMQGRSILFCVMLHYACFRVMPSQIWYQSSWYQNVGIRSLAPRFRYQRFGSKVLVPRSWYQECGIKILVPRTCYQDLGSNITTPSSWYQISVQNVALLHKLAASHRVNELLVNKVCAMQCQNLPCPCVRAMSRRPCVFIYMCRVFCHCLLPAHRQLWRKLLPTM